MRRRAFLDLGRAFGQMALAQVALASENVASSELY